MILMYTGELKKIKKNDRLDNHSIIHAALPGKGKGLESLLKSLEFNGEFRHLPFLPLWPLRIFQVSPCQF